MIMSKDKCFWENAVPIDGFPEYRVDRSGNVYNSKQQILKPDVSSKGYLRVSLSNATIKHKRFLVHRLVAQAFIPNPEKLAQVNHIDGDKANNNAENLEWCTPLANLLHSDIIAKASKAKERKIRCVTSGKIYSSINEAVCELGVSHSNIVACCAGRRNKCGGMEWKYEM